MGRARETWLPAKLGRNINEHLELYWKQNGSILQSVAFTNFVSRFEGCKFKISQRSLYKALYDNKLKMAVIYTSWVSSGSQKSLFVLVYQFCQFDSFQLVYLSMSRCQLAL